jgi:hypothetical protein
LSPQVEIDSVKKNASISKERTLKNFSVNNPIHNSTSKSAFEVSLEVGSKVKSSIQRNESSDKKQV